MTKELINITASVETDNPRQSEKIFEMLEKLGITVTGASTELRTDEDVSLPHPPIKSAYDLTRNELEAARTLTKGEFVAFTIAAGFSKSGAGRAWYGALDLADRFEAPENSKWGSRSRRHDSPSKAFMHTIDLYSLHGAMRAIETGDRGYISKGMWNICARLTNRTLGGDEAFGVILPWDDTIHPKLGRYWGDISEATAKLTAKYQAQEESQN